MLTERDLDRIVFGCGNFGGIGSAPNLRGAGDGEEQALRLRSVRPGDPCRRIAGSGYAVRIRR